MDGLECSEVMISITKSQSPRLDAEYYSKENLKLQAAMERIDGTTVASCGGVCDCSAFYPAITSYYSNDRSNIPFLRVNEIVNGLVTITEKTAFLPKKLLDINSKTIARAYPGDIIIAKGGNSLAKVGLVTNEFSEYATCRDVIILRTESLSGINPYYLWAFLHSKYGQAIMWRSASRTGQPHLTLPSIVNIHIPHTTGTLSQACETLYKMSAESKIKAQTTYALAEEMILSSICYTPSVETRNHTTKSFSESFGLTGRLDAEYYQPKYDELRTNLHTADTVQSLCVLHDKNFIPDEKKEYRYIELADVGQSGEISRVETTLGIDLPSRARRTVKAGQVIISSVEGSLQSCALITDEYDGALCSTGFYVLTSNSINPETLFVLFKSEPIQALMKQRCSGTILSAISKDELLALPLPKVDDSVQIKVAEKVQEAFSLRRRSERLLENAKHAVELAIEQGEDAAMKWLQEQDCTQSTP